MEHSKKILISMIIVSTFIFIVSMSSLYVQYHIETGNVCGCAIPLYLFIPFLSSLGLFIGILLYYLLFVKVETKKDFLKEYSDKILLLLNPQERKILKLIIEKPMTQSSIMKITGYDKVKTFRLIKRMELRGIIKRERYGKTYMIRLSDEIKDIFE